MKTFEHTIAGRAVEVNSFLSTIKETRELIDAFATSIKDYGDSLFNSNNGYMVAIKVDKDGDIFLHTNAVNYWYRLPDSYLAG